jgi:EmrB/QacA subfamily drug resistance transporter
MSKIEDVSVAAPDRRTGHPGLTLLVIVGAQLMMVLDGTIVNIALPRMGEYFHRSQTDMTWAVNGYTLAFGGLLLLGGRAGDILGRRRMLMIGLTVFTIGSLSGGLAPNFAVLLTGRVLQGVGAALASPAALALLTTEFAAGPARTRALAVYSGVQGAGGAVGVLLGGVLTEYFSWRWVLFVNVPIGLVLIPATYLYLRESPRQPGRFDWFGALLSTAGTVSLVYGFIAAAKPGYGWRDPVTLTAFGLAVVLLAGFVALEARLPYAMMPLRILRDRNRAGAYVAMLSIGAALAGMFFFVTFFIQLVLGFSALQNGVANLPVAFSVAVGAVVADKVLPRIGPRNGILFGALFVAAGLFWLSTVDANSGYPDTLLPALILFAFGTGQVLVPLTTVVVTRVAPQEMGLATSLLNVGQQVGAAIGLSVLTTVFGTGLANEARHQFALLGAKVQTGQAAPAVLQHFQSLLKQGLSAPFSATRDPLATHAAHAAIAHGTAVGFFTAGLLALVGGILARTLITLRREDVAAAVPAEPVAPQSEGR